MFRHFRRVMASPVAAFFLIGLVGCGQEPSTAEQHPKADEVRHDVAAPPAAVGRPSKPEAANRREDQAIAKSGAASKSNPAVKAVPKPAPPPPPWQLLALKGAEGKLDLSADGVMKITIPKLSDGAPWHVQLMGPVVACEAGTTYSVSFRARATEPRVLVVMAVKSQAPGETVGLAQEVPLTEEWRSFRFDFKPQGDADKARLRFNLGMSQAGVEVADVAFGPQRWALRAGGDPTATMEVPPGLATAVRVTPGQAVDPEKPWSVLLRCPKLPMVEGEEYYVSLRGRAEAPRKVIAKVAMGHEPWEGLGCYRTVELGTDWQSHGFTFRAKAGDPAAQFDLLLGDSDTPLELQSASVRPASAWKVIAAKDHPAVLTFPAADGQRPTASATVTPVSGDLMRVDFGRQETLEPWRVRLAAAPRSLRLDSDYEVVFKARAERPRAVAASLRRADGDGENIGLYAKVSLTDAWQTFTRRFTAKATTDKASFGFELGGSDAAVEFADVELREAAR